MIKGSKHSKASLEKIRRNSTGWNRGTNAPHWKGDNIKYTQLHRWLRSTYGNPQHCENNKCKKKCKTFDWALKKGKTYLRRRNHFIRLCRSCHLKQDQNARKK